MTAPTWQALCNIVVPAKPAHGIWTPFDLYVEQPARLRFEVPDVRPVAGGGANSWKYGDLVCSADGSLNVPVDVAKTLVPTALAGALIAKVGGSSAGTADGAVLFVVGSFCVFELTGTQRGPLFLTMNADPASQVSPSGNLDVKIYEAK